MKIAPPTVYYAEQPHSSLGLIWAAATDKGLWSLSYGIDAQEFKDHILERGPATLIYEEAKLAAALSQVQDFLEGKRERFDLPIDWRGMTDFQIAVRKAVIDLPYGETASYGDIAAKVGNPRAARAVGAVQASNPISFVIPCHRVLGADGSLHGYGGFGGLATKAWLLQLEDNDN
jgi:O-6-methylguanine DNA methyltransferase